MARLIWAAAARRGAAVATSTPVLIDIPPGKPKRICSCPALGGHRGKGSALEVFTEGEEQGEHGPRRADVEGGVAAEYHQRRRGDPTKTTGGEPRITNSSGNVARESLPQKRRREIAIKVGREAA